MPQSASHRQTSWTAGRASGRLVAVACALNGGDAGPGGSELAIRGRRRPRRDLSALRWPRNGGGCASDEASTVLRAPILNMTRRNDQHGQRMATDTWRK